MIHYGTSQSLQPFGTSCLLQHVSQDVGGDLRKDEIDVSYQKFGTKKKAKTFARNKLAPPR